MGSLTGVHSPFPSFYKEYPGIWQGIVRLVATVPTWPNQELVRRISGITGKEVPVNPVAASATEYAGRQAESEHKRFPGEE